MWVSALKDDQSYGNGNREPGERVEKDTEGQSNCSRSYSRIGPAVGIATDSASDKVDIGQQIEMEADAAIKYRTCSWQKVGFPRLLLKASHARLMARAWITKFWELGLTTWLCRLLRCSSRSTFAWLSCLFHIHIQS